MRFIQCGVGSFGRSWVDVLRRSPDVELVGVVDVSAEARRRVSDTVSIPTFASLDEALAQVDFDAALVTTPPATHHALSTQLLQAGKRVLSEKPLATSMDEARDLAQIMDETGCILMVSQNYRFRPHARAAQAVIAQGALGALTYVKIRFERDTRTLWSPDNFRYAMPYPLTLDMSIHHFDLLRALTGQNVQRLYAQEWPVPDSRYRYPPTLAATMILAGGATVIYEGNWAGRGRNISWNGAWEIVGERGRLLWNPGPTDSEEVWLELWGQEAQLVEPAPLAVTERDATLAAFIQAMASGEAPETNAADNIHSLAIVLGCIESITGFKAVELSGSPTTSHA